MLVTAPPGGLSTQDGLHEPVLEISRAVRRLFLDLGSDEVRRAKADEILHRIHGESLAESCIKTVTDRLVNFPSVHGLGLGLYLLNEILLLQPHAVVRCLEPATVNGLFSHATEDNAGAAFLHSWLCCKTSQGMSVEAEGVKLQKLLLRRAKMQDLRRVAASPLRAWMCRIWLDAPSSQSNRQLVVQCCTRWIADKHTDLVHKIPCLRIMRREFELRTRPDAETWLLGLLLEQVCRDPVGHSHDLQHLLLLLGAAPDSDAFTPLLQDLAVEQGRLVTLWICLIVWTPQMPPADAGLPPWPSGAPLPLHALLLSLFAVFWKMVGDAEFCRSCLLSLTMVAGGGSAGGTTAAAAGDLLSLLFRDGPSLPSDIWSTVSATIEANPELQHLNCIAGYHEAGSQMKQQQHHQQWENFGHWPDGFRA